MLSWLKYYAAGSGKPCGMVDQAIQELRSEHERYLAVQVRRIDVDSDINHCQRVFMKNLHI